MDAKALQAERISLYDDYYNHKIPKRLPVSMSTSHHILAELGGIDFFDFQYDYGRLSEEAEKMCERLYSDTCPVGGVGAASRIPAYYQLLESLSLQMGSGGFVQHPNTIGMLYEDYEALIADPYAALLEIVIPRQFPGLSMDDPVKRGSAIHMSIQSRLEDGMGLAPTIAALMEKYGYYPGPPRGSSGGFTTAPYDFLADQLRSFTEISKDIRRNRQLVLDACEALYPLMFLNGLPQLPAPQGGSGSPLHMPTYMREKDFVEVWLPTYRRMLEQYAARGVRINIFCEHDWMRYLDILADLPVGNTYRFEFGDPQLVKDKLGGKYFLSGLYPILNVKTKTKQENIDEVKKLLDIMMPGGGYLFGFDKGPILLSDIPMENYCAVAETVRDYAVYDNAGASFGTPLNSEKFKADPTPRIVSKYAFNWDDFKAQYPYTPDFARERMERYHHDMYKYYISLLG
ncbi:MAG: hypothetical protein FWG10_06215 [Eubacteriaceae bacterium]|nr:hypothetical protein [Eubacteriaceae bacterium]